MPDHYYDPSRYRLKIYIKGQEYVYGGVSPAHSNKFKGLKLRNFGRAMAYIRQFPLLERCPVCGQEHVGEGDVCACGWTGHSISQTPKMCAGGPNHAPLSMIRRRWANGERDINRLGMCPYGNRCRECPSYSLAKETG